MMMENLPEILAKKGRHFAIAYKCRLSYKCFEQEYFLSNLWNNYCETVW